MEIVNEEDEGLETPTDDAHETFESKIELILGLGTVLMHNVRNSRQAHRRAHVQDFGEFWNKVKK